MAGYTQVGPFINGSAPGISASFLNGLETWIRQSEGDIGVVTVSGQTSGTAKLYQFTQGVIKCAIVVLNNYKNTATQAIALPIAFTGRVNFQTGDLGNGHWDAKLSGGAVTINTITALAQGGGTVTGGTFSGGYCIGDLAAFDTLDLQTNTGAANGVLAFEGS